MSFDLNEGNNRTWALFSNVFLYSNAFHQIFKNFWDKVENI